MVYDHEVERQKARRAAIEGGEILKAQLDAARNK